MVFKRKNKTEKPYQEQEKKREASILLIDFINKKMKEGMTTDNREVQMIIKWL